MAAYVTGSGARGQHHRTPIFERALLDSSTWRVSLEASCVWQGRAPQLNRFATGWNGIRPIFSGLMPRNRWAMTVFPDATRVVQAASLREIASAGQSMGSYCVRAGVEKPNFRNTPRASSPSR